MVAPLVADPPHVNSATDTYTHLISDISMVNLVLWSYRQDLDHSAKRGEVSVGLVTEYLGGRGM